MLVALALCVASGAYAAESTDEAVLGNNRWSVQNDGDFVPNTASSYDIGSSGSPVDAIYAESVTLTTKIVGTVDLPILSATTAGAPLSASTTPKLEIDNLLPAVVWVDGDASPVQITLRVPADYVSGGAFRVFADSSDSTTPEQVDFSVYVNGHNTAWDSAATGQTPVALSTAASTPCVVTLTPATDFASLAAGKVVTLNLWRDDDSSGTGDLEVYYAEFFYNRK
jgi:hypothetical protein